MYTLPQDHRPASTAFPATSSHEFRNAASFACSIAASLPPEQSRARTLAASASAHATAKGGRQSADAFQLKPLRQGDEAEYRNFGPKPSPNAPNFRQRGARPIQQPYRRNASCAACWAKRVAVNFETEPTWMAFTQGFDVPQEDDQLSRRQAGRPSSSQEPVIGNKYNSYIFIVLS